MSSPVATSALRVLVVVDQQSVAEVIKLTLNHGVYIAREAQNVAAAATIIDEWRPQIAVIDIEAWGDQPLRVTSGALPPGIPHMPVIALTRRGDLRTKLRAFEQGVDDIMTVPFSPEELLARVMAVTRRTYRHSGQLAPVIKVGELEIDILNREVRVGPSVIHLSGLEQALLYLLAANAGKVLSRDEIMDVIWGADFVAESNLVDRHIRNLRVKLQNDWRRPRFIATVPGQGYRFLPFQ